MNGTTNTQSYIPNTKAIIILYNIIMWVRRGDIFMFKIPNLNRPLAEIILGYYIPIDIDNPCTHLLPSISIPMEILNLP